MHTDKPHSAIAGPSGRASSTIAHRIAILGVVLLNGVPALAPTSAAELSAPAVLKNESTIPGVVEVTLTAAPATLELQPGVMTEVFAYNGMFPGPTLEANEGDRIIVHFRNDLPDATTVHWHGIHLPVGQDGSPFDPIPAGGRRDYVFTVQRGTAGTYWYHPHLHPRTGYQIGKGLVGALIVRDPDDPIRALNEKLIILADQRFASDGSIDLPARTTPQGRIDEENGREGDVFFVTGQINPTISIRPGEVQRWRVINASGARVYRLAIPGQSFLHVANDGGLFERPREVSDIIIANSERVELLVRGTGAAGRSVSLQSLPYDRYIPQTRPANWNQPIDLATIQVSGAPAPAYTVPAQLRVVPRIDTTRVIARRTVSLAQMMIDNKKMDMNRVDIVARLGATEIWTVENLVGMDHPFHLHGFQFQVIERNGKPEPYVSWQDVVNIPKHESARFIVRFDHFGGKWMYHCHILTHEDQGMMGILEVRP